MTERPLKVWRERHWLGEGGGWRWACWPCAQRGVLISAHALRAPSQPVALRQALRHLDSRHRGMTSGPVRPLDTGDPPHDLLRSGGRPVRRPGIRKVGTDVRD